MHHLHDGPWAYLPLGPRQPTPAPKKKPVATLAALQWAADREGQSYGRFTLNLTEGEQGRIQEQYEAYLTDRRRAQAAQAQAAQPSVDNQQFEGEPS